MEVVGGTVVAAAVDGTVVGAEVDGMVEAEVDGMVAAIIHTTKRVPEAMRLIKPRQRLIQEINTCPINQDTNKNLTQTLASLLNNFLLHSGDIDV
ncbi:Hypothetical predicted protein [Olea europaea subsp. europaea]|uniref:Uncharacterized protein n=2 Tax=Olea europaea subsp. europaea TaxID=158383 RepID=A0A8S0PCD9_OLEEU|nr:Hypothetical predicted protein [Olea europaea subsp. europaea]